MVQEAVVIPVAVLCSLCIVMFIFIWWWFPRTYRKGVEKDMVDIDEARRTGTLITMSDLEAAKQAERDRAEAVAKGADGAEIQMTEAEERVAALRRNYKPQQVAVF